MSFEELNVPKNHIYLFKPHFDIHVPAKRWRVESAAHFLL